MRSKRNVWLLIVLLLAGALIGGFAGELLSQNPYLAWLSLGGKNGYRELFSLSFDPLFDARILRFGFDFAMSINVGSIIGMLLGIIVFLRIRP
jgi:hypothetical protein